MFPPSSPDSALLQTFLALLVCTPSAPDTSHPWPCQQEVVGGGSAYWFPFSPSWSPTFIFAPAWVSRGHRSLQDLPSVQFSVCSQKHLQVSSCVSLCAFSHTASYLLGSLHCDSPFVTQWVSATGCRAVWNQLRMTQGSSQPHPTKVTPAAVLPVLPSTGLQVGTNCVDVGSVLPMAQLICNGFISKEACQEAIYSI